MKKILWIIVCLMAMAVSANAQDTYKKDGITYEKTGGSVTIYGCKLDAWKVTKVDKPNVKKIVIPYAEIINGEEVRITETGPNIFSSCSSMDSLVICDGVRIGERTFSGCKQLDYLYYSNTSSATETYIGNLSCKTLETSGVRIKGFWDVISNSLEKLIITKDTNSKSFYNGIRGCKNLNTIVSYAYDPPTGGLSYYSNWSASGPTQFETYQYSKITLYVLSESLEKYRNTNNWGKIENIYPIDEISTSINNTSINVIENGVQYSINGTKVKTLNKGIYIKNGKKYIKN